MAPLFLISDVHGFRDDLVGVLREAELLDESERWSGEDAQLWILGDLADRGPNGIGVIDLVMSLQQQAPEQVHMLMGNHEALTLGMKRFPHSRFADSWLINGGRWSDQDGLNDEHLTWLAELPLVARVGNLLLMHSDTTAYLSWGSTIDEINATVRDALATDDVDAHWDVWAQLTSRYDFAREGGSHAAREVLGTLGGHYIVHGHSVIGSLLGIASEEVEGPILYADELVLDIDGGRYDGGPLLLVQADGLMSDDEPEADR